MPMRAATSLYVHPELTDSDVWFTPRSSSSSSSSQHKSKPIVYALFGGLSLVAASTLAVYQYTSIGRLIQQSPLVRHWL
ncbi:hypothetical protein AMATHDRAFT_2447 [Amanita thiersii Skay4041]|uniref:Uncharacterized protein n=1 Tax=Amanita thiersii Skay4041 TaxID=703135 RepID=A0A2A9NMJ9_9AGAR|nr:hypothetical protein AMATHDRAFT_2447 [Amanita thiersii Skay4041]